MRPRVRGQKNFGPMRKKIAEKFGGFRNLPYLCPRLQHGGRPLGRAHVRRSAEMPGIFYAQCATDKDGCLLVTLNSPSGEVTML